MKASSRLYECFNNKILRQKKTIDPILLNLDLFREKKFIAKSIANILSVLLALILNQLNNH